MRLRRPLLLLTLVLALLALEAPAPIPVSGEPPPPPMATRAAAHRSPIPTAERAVAAPLTTPAALVLAAPARIPAPRHIRLDAAGISARVRALRCGIPRLPDGRIWNWRCAAPSNPTLLAHAWGAFRALSRAYDRGRIQVGTVMRVRGADGVTRKYRLAWARVVRRERVDWWAFGATTRPSITLITCRGRRSTHRLVVRFELAR